jgi:triosephosphate isomerase
MKYLVANWKSNKTIQEAVTWINTVKKAKLSIPSSFKIIICPSYLHLHLFINQLPRFTLGVQTLSPYPDGAYTGAISARMLPSQVKFAILGHSERRQYFADTNTTVAQQARLALENNLTPIIAVDKNNWRSQLNHFPASQLKKIIIMYEPPEAISLQVGPIGQGKPAPLKDFIKMTQTIKKEFPSRAVLYGGSVKANNINEFICQKEIDGVVPGSASLNPQEFINMVKVAASIA